MCYGVFYIRFFVFGFGFYWLVLYIFKLFEGVIVVMFLGVLRSWVFSLCEDDNFFVNLVLDVVICILKLECIVEVF